MDIEEIKKYSQNKIEADNLIKQVRQQIKETTWEKQNLREGFTETFKPLISQFEEPEYIENPEGPDKPKIPKKKNIFSQNQEMLQNQLALTEGVKNNQLTLKDIKDQQRHFNRALEYLENLAHMGEMPGIAAIKDDEKDSEDDKDDQARAPTPTPPKSSTPTPQAEKKPVTEFSLDIFDKNLNNKKTLDILSSYGYTSLPSSYFGNSIEDINSLIDTVRIDLEDVQKELSKNIEFVEEGIYHLAVPKAENPRIKTKQGIDNYNVLSIFHTNLNLLYEVKKNEKSGSGLFNTPQELLHRFELLNGSLVAGNNGVLPELIQIAHRLRDLGILTNKQLNTLLRKII